MSLLILQPGARISTSRGDPVIVIVGRANDHAIAGCLNAVLEHTPELVPKILLDDGDPDPFSEEVMTDLRSGSSQARALYYSRSSTELRGAASLNDVLDRCSPADVIILDGGSVVSHGWLEAIKDAAEDTLVATVSAFGDRGKIAPWPESEAPERLERTSVDLVAEAISRRSLRIRPDLPSPSGACVLLKRSAIELVGPLDEKSGSCWHAAVDFSQRCVHHGLRSVLADDVFVPGGDPGLAGAPAGDRAYAGEGSTTERRYGYYSDWIASVSTHPALAHAVGIARSAVRELSVTLDARSLTQAAGFQWMYTLELVGALGRYSGLRVRAIVPDRLIAGASDSLQSVAGVELVPASAVAELRPTDVVHRPTEVPTRADLALLTRLGNRLVINGQGLVKFRIPSYFSSVEDWRDYRTLLEEAFGAADRVVFSSHSAAHEALAEELLPRELAHIIYLGTDHDLRAHDHGTNRPNRMEQLGECPFLLCLGSNAAHENRLFALRLLATLKRDHAWPGGLVFSGPHVPIGSSAADEAAFRAANPEIASVVVDLAEVTDAERQWLLEKSAMLLCPAVSVGSPLLPFEAAEAGVPCAFGPDAALIEVLGSRLALIERWNPRQTCEQLVPVLHDPAHRRAHIRAIRAAGARFTWRRAAQGLTAVYEAAVRSPVRPSRRLVSDLHELQQRYAWVDAQDAAELQALVGPGGAIPHDLHRPLLAMASRPALVAPAWGLMRASYRVGYRLRRVGRRST